MQTVLTATAEAIQPPPLLTVSQWADTNRVLSREGSAEPGQWDTARAEYQRGIMDAMNDPTIETIVFRASAQVGKSELLLNCLGYHIDLDPGPMLLVQPTLDMAGTFSRHRVATMIRDTPSLQGLVKDPRSRDGENSIFNKSFPGGYLAITGGNSPSSLSSRPVRICLFDEVDRLPASAGTEGDPVDLGIKRTTTFWNRLIVLISTPSIKGESRIDVAYEHSDQRKFHVPCPHCGQKQVLKWGGKDEAFGIKWQEIDGQIHAQYLCEFCGVLLEEGDKHHMIRAGSWVADNPGGRVAGFHINALYSPWKPWANCVEEFLQAKKNAHTLQVWINTVLGESYEEIGEKIEPHLLQEQSEDYGGWGAPEKVTIITGGIDVQEDRLEMEWVGWSEGEESFSLDYKVLRGDTSQDAVWEDLEEELDRTFNHPTFGQLGISMVLIDSGYLTDTVYSFCHGKKKIYPSQGLNNTPQKSRGIIEPNMKMKLKKTKKGAYVPVGVDSAKDLIYARLRFADPGPGFCHFPDHYDQDYFEQLTAEEKRTKYIKGRPVKYWHLTRGRRNEVLDCRVLALAALRYLPKWFSIESHRLKLEKIAAKKRGETIEEDQQPAEGGNKPKAPTITKPPRWPKRPHRARGGYI